VFSLDVFVLNGFELFFYDHFELGVFKLLMFITPYFIWFFVWCCFVVVVFVCFLFWFFVKKKDGCLFSFLVDFDCLSVFVDFIGFSESVFY
jgi:hypothetical protein